MGRYRKRFFVKAAVLSLASAISAAVLASSSATAAAATGQSRMTVSAVIVPSSSAPASKGNRGIGLGGFDPVAYRSGRGVKIGRADIETDWRGVTYRFNSELNRNVFLANPKVFLAQFEGHCAFAAAMGRKLAADPSAWAVHDGKIYLFNNQRAKSIWQQNVSNNIMLAETNWPSLR